MSLEALAAELAGKPADDVIWEDTPELLPGVDYHDGVLYMTFPTQRRTQVKVGRGKNAEMVEKIVTETLCISSERERFWYNAEEAAERGFILPHTVTQDSESRWSRAEMKQFLDGKAPTIESQALFEEIRQIYRDHLEFADEVYYDVLPLFIMHSYLFRLFRSTGYLHFHGTAASGKSQNLRVLKALAFNTVWASSMSEASLFRQTAGCPGVICVDEAESFEGEKGQAIRLILNAGYLASTTATRAEKIGERFETIKYLVYSPKVLASINALEPVIQSRCVVVQMMPAIRPIPEFVDDHPKWTAVRAKLYLWAMQNADKVAHLALDWNERKRYVDASALVNRAWQIVQGYIVIADHVGGKEMYRPLIEHFGKYFEQVAKAQEETDRQRLLLKCLPRVLFGKQSYTIDGKGPWYRLKDIHDVFIDHIDEDVREYYKTRQTSRHLSSLGWKERRQAHGGTNVLLPEDDVRSQFKRRRVAPFEEDLEWLSGEKTYVHAAPSTATLFGATPDPQPEPEPTTDDYSWVDDLDADPAHT
jgi:hypothetical protein